MECRERNKAEQKVSCFVLPFDHEDDPPPSNSGRIRVRRRSLPPLIRSAGEPPAVLAAGSGPGEHGLAVFKVRFRGGVHIRRSKNSGDNARANSKNIHDQSFPPS
jgi:hypothetical protein